MQNNSEIKNRLNLFLAYLSIGQAKFAKNCGLSRGFANNVGGSIRSDKLKQITDTYPEFNSEWLLTGEGDMLKKNEEQTTPTPLIDPIYSTVIQSSEKIADAVLNIAKVNNTLADNNTKLMNSNCKLLETNTMLLERNTKLFESNQKLVDEILSLVKSQKRDAEDVGDAATKMAHG